jgi:Uma2 family endonuclease
VRAEWINGDIATSVWPDLAHQQAARRTANLLESALPDLVVASGVTLMLSEGLQPIADVVVADKAPEGTHLVEPPLLVAEVVAPDTWATDAVVKSAVYLQHGVQQYWLIQPSAGSIHVFDGTDGGWRLVATLDEARPRASVEVGAHGTVDVDLVAVLGVAGG